MYNFPIGIMLRSLKIEDTKAAIEKASKMGADGIQIHSTFGEFAPENITKDRTKELFDIIRSNGLIVSALCGDYGKGFWRTELNPQLIEKSKRILDLALEFECNIVTTHVGVIPENKNHERYKIMQEACFELAEYADKTKSHFAVETGPEIASTLKAFLDSLNSKGVAVNMDPANLVMITEDDPAEAVYTLKDYIVHTHAKDGIKLFDRSPEIIYKHDESAVINEKSYKEVPLGMGKVDFTKYLKALDDIGYKGFLTIEREVGEDPVKDIQTAIDFLNNKKEENN